MRLCKECLINKDELLFRDKRLVCKDCIKIKRRVYSTKNREKINEYKRSRYEIEKEKIQISLKNYYLKNRDSLISKMKEYGEKNKESITKYLKEYNRSDKRKQQRKTINHSRRLKKISGNKVTSLMLDNLIESQNYKCNDCTIYLDFKIKFFVHLDHIIPLSKGGEHKIGNLQYLCQKCNLKKSNKILIK